MPAVRRSPTHRAEGNAVCFRNVQVAPKLAAVTGSAVVAAGLGVTGAGVATADDAVWDKVAQCESSGNWSISTGNGYYGGLQFYQPTWKSFGGQEFATYAHQATKAEQIAVAQRVLARQGPGAWPVCGKRAGLTKANGGADANAQPDGRSSSTASRGSERTSAVSSSGALVVDGKFGPATTRSLEGWLGITPNGSLSTADIKVLQKRVGATQDGRIGADTTRKLRAVMGLSSNGAWDFRSDRSTVKALQTFLNSGATGAAPVASAPKTSAPKTAAPSTSASLVVDGKFGPATTRALESWIGVTPNGSLSTSDIKALQKKVGAVQDGKIGAETTRKLRAAMGYGNNGVWDFRTSYSTVKALQQYLNG